MNQQSVFSGGRHSHKCENCGVTFVRECAFGLACTYEYLTGPCSACQRASEVQDPYNFVGDQRKATQSAQRRARRDAANNLARTERIAYVERLRGYGYEG